MSEENFNSAFQRHLASQPSKLPSAHDIAGQVIARDQRRVIVLAVLSVVLWLLGAAGIMLLVIDLNEFVMGVRLSHAAERREAQGEPVAGKGPWEVNLGTDPFHHAFPLLIVGVGALPLAAVCTVLLIFTSRRATMNRINMSLAQICEQLKIMNRSPQGEGKPPDSG
jgi:ABC-type Fe3+ transport system permease subunit